MRAAVVAFTRRGAALGRRLADAGLPPDRVEGILGGNLLRFLQKHLPAEE